MTSALYNYGKAQILDANIDLNSTTQDIRAALVESGYVFDAAHDFLDHVTTYITVSSERMSAGMTNKTVTNGVFDADDVTFSSVTAGKTINSLVIYKYNASDAAAPLIAYIDGCTNFPLVTTGSNVIITWDAGANKIFKLS